MRNRIRLTLSFVLAIGLAGCGGPGFLSSLVYQGRTESGPRLPNGQQDGKWTYWYDVERKQVKAQGEYKEDMHVGTWTYWYANGNKMQVVHLDDDTFEGPIATFFENGKPRAQGTHHAGQKAGTWTFWREDGSKECEGNFARGERDGPWTFWQPDGTEIERAMFVRGELQPSAATKPSATTPATATVSPGPAPTPPPVAQASSGSSATSTTSAGSAASASSATPEPQKPTALILPAHLRTPKSGIESMPFTTLQRGEGANDPQVQGPASPGIDNLVRVYDHGKVGLTNGASDQYGAGDARNPASEPKRDDVKSDPLRGKLLPWTKVTREDGSVLDLASFRGKSKVLLIVMRGMKGPICEYCCGQAEALKHRVPDFKKAGAEVVIVYPGDEEVLALFQKRVQEYYVKHYGAEDHPECLLACDAGLRLVDALGVRRDLALPTAIIIDTKGIVQEAFVGRGKQDRPCADVLLEKVKAIP